MALTFYLKSRLSKFRHYIVNRYSTVLLSLKSKINPYIKDLEQDYEKRVSLLLILVLAFAFCIIISLFYTAVSGKKSYIAKDMSQIRGNIYDRNGIILADDAKSYDLYLEPANIPDISDNLDRLSMTLSDIFPRKERIFASLEAKRSTKKARVLIKQNISEDEKNQIIYNGVVGVNFEESSRRYYRFANKTSHIVGLISRDKAGLSGVEKYFDNELSFGKDINLSIDINVQSIVHETVKNVLTELRGTGAGAVMVKVNTGEVIAAVSLPDFDPNDTSTLNNNNMFNRFSLGSYELGSIFKIFNTAIAIENGLSMTKLYDVHSDLEADKKKISDFKKGSRSVMTIPEILMYSSNIGSGLVLQEFGHDKQRDFFERIGLLEKVRIEIPEIGRSIYPEKNEWKGMNAITMSYGHTIAVTPLHFIRAFANLIHGYKKDLTIIKKSDTIENEDVLMERDGVLQLRSILSDVITKGAGKRAHSIYYEVGGKSGTAIKNKARGGYDKDMNLLSFASFFPVDNPEYAMLIFVDNVSSKANRELFVGGRQIGPMVKNIIDASGPIMGIMSKNKTIKQEENVNYVKDEDFYDD
jgi:cell division protein FtsI (penicillin-binding protein 3)